MGSFYRTVRTDSVLHCSLHLVRLLLQLRDMVKWLLRCFYRFCDHLDRVMLVYCEYEKHSRGTQAYTKIMEEQIIELYAGPRDGAEMLYVGRVYRIAGHDGAYCFDGERYKWNQDAHSPHCE